MGLKVIVVGGGIAGLATACALKEEHDVTVRRIKVIVEQTRLKTETGAAIHLGPNASRLVIGWGCNLDESPHLTRLREETSQAELQMERMINAPVEFGAPWLLNHRVTLHHELLRVATSISSTGRTPQLKTGSRVLSIDEKAGVVHLEGGESLYGDVIIGADGIKSQVRASLFGDSFTAKPSGHSAYRGLVSREGYKREEKEGVASLTITLQIPAEKILADPELAYLMSPTGLSIFLGTDRKLVVYTCRYQGQDFLNLVAAVPDHGMSESSQESWYAPGKVEDLQAAFQGFAPKLLRMLSYVKECGLWQLRDQDPLEEWVKGRAIIIGDAAHPMTPHLGQGGSQAIEDADMLAYCLSGLNSSTNASTINEALQRTFTLRYERATMCQERSREQAFGKRAVQLESTTSIPSLNPMQFADYTFSYRGAKWWAEQQEGNNSSNSSSGSSDCDDKLSDALAHQVPEVATLSAT